MGDLVRDLGVTIDCRLTMADHVTAVCRTSYFWLRQLRSVVQSLTSEAADSLVHAFISCSLDYCNALLYGIADGQLQRLQSVQNAAARLVTEPGAPTTLLTHIKQQKYFHHLKRRGYNTEFLLYPRLFRWWKGRLDHHHNLLIIRRIIVIANFSCMSESWN